MTTKNTVPILTKYELTALISARAMEIADDQPITIQNPGTTDPIEIAWMEFNAKKCPKKIKRVWPDGRVEVWSVHDLQVI